MEKLERSIITPYTPRQIYDLVADVERYSEFLPGCDSVRVLERLEDRVRVAVGIGYKGIDRTFVTRNTLTPGKRIDMHLLEGPFRRLDGYWRFDPLGDGSKVVLRLDYEFSTRVVALVLGRVVAGVADTLVAAFVKRAREVYGRA